VLLRAYGRKKILGSMCFLTSRSISPRGRCFWKAANRISAIIAGFFTGGSLAVRGIHFPAFVSLEFLSQIADILAGPRSMRNSAIGCACLLAVFEGVGIGMQRLFAQPPMVES